MGKNEFMIFDSTRICPICQKEFVTPDPEVWVYKFWETSRKKNRIYFCSWKCMRKCESGDVDLKGRGMKLSTKKQRIWEMLDKGMTARHIAIMLEIPIRQVQYYKDKWVPKEEDDG